MLEVFSFICSFQKFWKSKQKILRKKGFSWVDQGTVQGKKASLQSNDIEGDIVTRYPSPHTAVWRWWIRPVIQHIVHIPKWLLYFQKTRPFVPKTKQNNKHLQWKSWREEKPKRIKICKQHNRSGIDPFRSSPILSRYSSSNLVKGLFKGLFTQSFRNILLFTIYKLRKSLYGLSNHQHNGI